MLSTYEEKCTQYITLVVHYSRNLPIFQKILAEERDITSRIWLLTLPHYLSLQPWINFLTSFRCNLDALQFLLALNSRDKNLHQKNPTFIYIRDSLSWLHYTTHKYLWRKSLSWLWPKSPWKLNFLFYYWDQLLGSPLAFKIAWLKPKFNAYYHAATRRFQYFFWYVITSSHLPSFMATLTSKGLTSVHYSLKTVLFEKSLP